MYEFLLSPYTTIALNWLSTAVVTLNGWMVTFYGWVYTGASWLSYPIIWFNDGLQVVGTWTLAATVWSVDIIKITYLWFYAILYDIFLWLVPYFQFFSQIRIEWKLA